MSKEQGREAVPTLHYPDLSKWRKTYKWDEWVATQEALADEIHRGAYLARRARAIDSLSLLVDDALVQLGMVINSEMTPPAVKVKAIEVVLDRIDAKIKPSETDDDLNDEPVPQLPENATEEEKIRFLSEVAG